ncbi:hypothetical protein LZ32DRAFT_442464 [Colletotrichum eremochloae]|nr:hypothetical protein LZ32DRAFT_442464 [Colletotrichum eremochloae]
MFSPRYARPFGHLAFTGKTSCAERTLSVNTALSFLATHETNIPILSIPSRPVTKYRLDEAIMGVSHPSLHSQDMVRSSLFSLWNFSLTILFPFLFSTLLLVAWSGEAGLTHLISIPPLSRCHSIAQLG